MRIRGVVLIGLLVSRTVAADEPVPVRYVDRPLVLPPMTLRGDFTFGYASHASPIPSSSGLSLGGGFGVIPNLELDATLLPLNLTPSASGGYGNPSISATYRFFNAQGLELGAGLDATWLRIPMADDQEAIHPRFDALYHFGDLRFDGQLGVSVIHGMMTHYGLQAPLSAAYQIQPDLAAGVTTGLGIYDLDFAGSSAYVPFEAWVGYTLPIKNWGLLDVHGGIEFPQVLLPGNDSQSTDTDDVGLFLSAAWYEAVDGKDHHASGPGGNDTTGGGNAAVDPCHGPKDKTSKPLTMDFTPGGFGVPEPKGRVFHFQNEDKTSGLSTGKMTAFTFLDFYLGGAGRETVEKGAPKEPGTDEFGLKYEMYKSEPAETDAVILDSDFVDYIQQQEEVRLLAQTAETQLKAESPQVFRALACDQSGTWTDGGRATIAGDSSATPIHLALGTFSVYWQATCTIGPKQCCIKDASCQPSGMSMSTTYTCQIKWTEYDVYNFDFKTGTGDNWFTKGLKWINPIGRAGTKFEDFGYWTSVVNGSSRACM